MTSTRARIAALMRVLDPECAAAVTTALRGQERMFAASGRTLPSPAAELLAELLVVRSGQSSPLEVGIGDGLGRVGQGSSSYLLDVDEAAAVVGVSVRTLRRRLVDGTLPTRRLGRRVLIDPVDLLDHLAEEYPR